jgi:Pup amidohydrolase
LETDPLLVVDVVDWVAKKRLIDGFRERHGCQPDDARLRVIDLQYHDIRPAKSLAARAGLATLLDNDLIEEAVTEPPTDTRAYFRGKCLQKFASSIAAANWDSLVFDLGTDPLRRVPMMEPLRGTADMVAELLNSCSTPAELLSRLGA